jgi:hypothetical protein
MQAPAPIASTLPEPVLLREDAGGITVLTLNRPERRNSLSDALLVALTEAFSAIARIAPSRRSSSPQTAPCSVPAMTSRR